MVKQKIILVISLVLAYRGQYTPASGLLPDGLSSSKDTRLRKEEAGREREREKGREEGKNEKVTYLAGETICYF